MSFVSVYPLCPFVFVLPVHVKERFLTFLTLIYQDIGINVRRW